MLPTSKVIIKVIYMPVSDIDKAYIRQRAVTGTKFYVQQK